MEIRGQPLFLYLLAIITAVGGMVVFLMHFKTNYNITSDQSFCLLVAGPSGARIEAARYVQHSTEK